MTASSTTAIWASSFFTRSLEGRDRALDVFRGLAVTGMILVNHPPATQAPYAPFVHAEWHGWTLADTIFPAFLFAVGVSIAYSMPAQRAVSARSVYLRIARRWLLLMLLSVMLVNFPYYELAKLRISGVLAQIAWCYLAVSLLHLRATWRAETIVLLGILMLHWALLAGLPVPGFGAGQLTPQGNASRYVDELVLGRWAYMFGDNASGGLMMILSSIATTLTGLLSGRWLRSGADTPRKLNGLFATGLVLFAVAHVWQAVLPINKPLWTGSFVVLTTGISLQLLALLYWLQQIDLLGSWAKPLHVAGVNALVFYVAAQSLQRVLVYGRVRDESGEVVRLRYLVYEHVFQPWVSGKVGALAYTLAFMSVCYVLLAWLYHRRIFVKL